MYVFKRKRRRNGRTEESRHYYGRFSVPGGSSERIVNLGTRFKDVAEQKLRDIARDAEREALGIAPPRLLVDAASRPLVEHLDEFVTELRFLGRSSVYVYNVECHVTRIAKACGWKLLRDVTADSYVRWRSTIRGRSAKTLNDYTNYCHTFFGWLVRKGRLVADPLKLVGRVDGDTVRNRRAIKDDEAARLLEVAGARRIVYLTALLTGLRRAELATLAWADLRLEGINPSIKLQRKNEKNRRGSVLPVRSDLAEELRRYRESSKGELVFGELVPTMKTFRADLATAGIAYIDDQGRRFDFHAIRHTFGTNLSRAGVPLVTAMALMRHSDPKLTSRVYTDARALPVMDALDGLPSFQHASPGREACVRTGTDDLPNDEKGTVKGTGNSVQSCLRLSKPAEDETIPETENRPVLPSDCDSKSDNVQNCPDVGISSADRIRTDAKSPDFPAAGEQGTVNGDLEEIINAWTKLPATVQGAILAIIRSVD